MALAAVGRGVWEGDTPPFPRGRLRRPGTPLGTWPFLWGPFLGTLFSRVARSCPQGQTGPVSTLGSVWGTSGRGSWPTCLRSSH